LKWVNLFALGDFALFEFKAIQVNMSKLCASVCCKVELKPFRKSEFFWKSYLPNPNKDSDGSGSKHFDPGRVSHLWFGIGFGKFLLKISIFSIFCPTGKKKSHCVGPKSTWVKAGSASYLLWVKSVLGLDRVRAHL